jgi:hypothetical protein
MPEASPTAPRDSEGDWPAQAADAIVRVVGEVRDATTGRAIQAARGAVYGLLAGLLGATIGVLVAIAAVRLLVVYLPDAWFGDTHVWAAHLLTGLAFTGLGLFFWSRRNRADEV